MSMDGMTPEARAAWSRLTKSYGSELPTNSAYRDKDHNAKVGGAKNSQHTHGNAFDVNVRDLSRDQRLGLITQARAAGFNGIGVYNNALHFDVGPSRAWGSDYTSKTLPDWAKGAVGAPAGPQGTSGGGNPTQNALAMPDAQFQAIPMAPMGQYGQQQQQAQGQQQQDQEQGPPRVTNMLNPADFQTRQVPYQIARFT